MLGAVRVAVHEACDGRWEALNRLVEVLIEVDSVGNEVVARSALALVAGLPGLVVRLDEHARSAPWYAHYQEPAMQRVSERFSGFVVGCAEADGGAPPEFDHAEKPRGSRRSVRRS
ncbi:hypothetical protein [Micromonospora sp. NBC_01638]|uniref:hypothetical protein n=1 Tax=Micromonospora sp. NBC_01638 TaxID=2975982 RepID=UPI00386622F9|nr:hypothetical protein OG811_24010 [Micromonospora sp. NBC_01638]